MIRENEARGRYDVRHNCAVAEELPSIRVGLLQISALAEHGNTCQEAQGRFPFYRTYQDRSFWHFPGSFGSTSDFNMGH